ncbi:C-type lectin domain family 12 member B-like [Perca fluviatilis]|uniref:C-type lectin domain family 12 member B-like n=1 Tax=Perca fluviatilis TaxID=8168 RepID=UPI0019657575|nr:C-type lectin domain family 12 member B-like [Perca fluviatilis]
MNRNPQEEMKSRKQQLTMLMRQHALWRKWQLVQRFCCFSQYFLPIAVCWLILLVIMGLRIYFTNCNLNDKLSVSGNQITDLTAVNQELETRNQELETRNQELETRNQELETRNQELETERNNLRGPIQNISRTQWSIDEYCPKVNNERRCQPCQKDWRVFNESSCYLINDPPDQKTWEEAREDCRARSSDLVVLDDEVERNVLSRYSWYGYGYWFGLRSEGGRWKWIDGRDLTESFWIPTPLPPPADGQCAVLVQDIWRSESSADRRPWICQKKALSV